MHIFMITLRKNTHMHMYVVYVCRCVPVKEHRHIQSNVVEHTQSTLTHGHWRSVLILPFVFLKVTKTREK